MIIIKLNSQHIFFQHQFSILEYKKTFLSVAQIRQNQQKRNDGIISDILFYLYLSYHLKLSETFFNIMYCLLFLFVIFATNKNVIVKI